MNKTMKKSLLLASVFLFSVTVSFATVKEIPVKVRNNVAPSVVRASKVLGKELGKLGSSVKLIRKKNYNDIDSSVVEVFAGNVENYLNHEMAYDRGYVVPKEPESYIIRVWGNNVYVVGSDETGAMYGLYDLAEQIRWHGSMEGFPGFIKEKTETPYVEIRGINQFLHTQALWDKDSWFFDLNFWEKYLDALSFNRINFLDIHAVYDVYNTDFLNFFAYFVKSDKFPDVGLSKEVCDKNLEIFRKIVHMAKERGIKTGLMNYNFTSYMGGQPRPGRFRDDPKVTLPRLNEKEEEVYIREVTSKFLREVPELWTFGFRIGESGKKLDFFSDTFIKGIRESGREGMPLISRSWLSTRRLIDKMSEDYSGKVYIEVKYNGEQFGVPYQAISGGKRPWHLSYSYEEYTDLPRNFDLIWQIRFNGDHRLFPWANADYVKRTVKTMHFANGAGFSIEPMQAYYPYEDFASNIPKGENYYKWGFQRDWLWNVMWGRLSYNPDEDERVYMYGMEKRFGKKAAPDVLKVVETSSEVIPLIYQTHCTGVDHRAAAPEFETGNGLDKDFKPDDLNYDKGIDSFITVEPLDIGSFMTIKEYVNNVLAGRVSGKFSPVDVSEKLKNLSERIESALNASSLNTLGGNAEYETYSADAKILSGLALYYSEKFLAATDLGFYYRTGDRNRLESALEHARNAYENWKEMAKTGDAFYHPFPDQLRMRTNEYTWGSQLKFLQKDVDMIRNLVDGKGDEVFTGIGFVPVAGVKLNDEILVSATLYVPGSSGVYVNYRRAGDKRFVSKKLAAAGGNVFEGSIDKSVTKKDGVVEYYLSAKVNGHDVTFRPFDKENPVKVVVSNDDEVPQFRHVPEQPGGHPEKVRISVRVTDNSGVGSVKLYYKELPSYLLWKSVEMKPAGDDVYEAEVPLNKHGLMYRFEVADVHNNAVIYPDPARETPYYVIDAWE